MNNTVRRMKTTLNIDPTIMTQLKREAARQGRIMSDMVETALRLTLRGGRKRAFLPESSMWNSGSDRLE